MRGSAVQSDTVCTGAVSDSSCPTTIEHEEEPRQVQAQ